MKMSLFLSNQIKQVLEIGLGLEYLWPHVGEVAKMLQFIT